MDESIKPIRSKNPRENANIFSIATFSYTLPTFLMGYKKELHENDIYETVSDCKCYKEGNKVEKIWLKEMKTCRNTNKNPSLWKVFLKSFGKEYIIIGITMGFVDIVLKTLQTLSLGDLISSLSNADNDRNKSDIYIHATKLIIYSFLIVFINTPVITNGYLLGLKLRSVCSFMVYRKSLKLSKTAFAKLSSGQMMNIISNDIKKFEKYTLNTHFLWIGPVQTAVLSYFMYQEVGYSAFVGILFLLCFIPLFSFLGKIYSVYRSKSATRTDERIRIMNEIILGISIIKMCTWEKSFGRLVSTYRRLEMKAIKITLYLIGLSSALSILNNRIAVFITIVAHILMQEKINARQVFTLIAFYNLLRNTMVIFFPDSVALAADMNVCFKRLANLLLLEEVQDKKVQSDNRKDFPVILENATAKWTQATVENTFSNITLKIKNSSLTAIIGPVGSGKTSLLYCILNELPLTKGTISAQGKISYASQEPWLFPESIKQNILFGSKFDSQRYDEVVKVCALESDFQLLPYGDNTIIGERGSSLSGGQRSRVNLARAIYRDADIYLLDDPLSAVDTRVGKEIFKNCIKSYLKHKAVVLVTHQLQYLKDADYLIILENGQLLAQGTPEELQETGINFAKFLKENVACIDDKASYNLFTSEDLRKTEPEIPIRSKVQEERSSGTLSKNVYLSYIKSGSNSAFIVLTLAIFILVQILTSCVDYFLAYWVNLNEIEFERSKIILMLTYTGLLIALIVLSLGRLVTFTQLCINASINLHDTMFNSLVRATMRFFNTNPSGRILNRFSKDIGLIDEFLPTCVLDTLNICLISISVVILVSIINYWLLLAAIALTTISYFLRLFYIPTSRSLKRLDGLTRSPVMSHLNYSLQGLPTIRAFEIQKTLENEFANHQDLNTTVACLFISASKAFGYWLDLCCVVYVTFVTLACVFMNEGVNVGGNAGLIITQCLALTNYFQWGVRQLTETENQMTAVERVLEYNEVEHEPPFENPNNAPKRSWPEYGAIQFNNLCLRYFPNEPDVLKNLNFTIQPLEKVGIVGRTGAGKSSLIAAIFRLTDIEGTIIIDEVDIKTIGLHDLRSKISIIPQEPILFSGSMRKNLDPFVEYSDDDIWKVLEEVELKDVISNLISGLDSEINEGGSNLSVGQRQLVCLARAMLRKNKILILDEATANVDTITDMLIQKTIRKKFIDCTVLTIAHRLDTVMDSDKILVMNAGEVAEFDHPHLLLQNDKGVLHSMAQQTGEVIFQTLRDVAKNTYDKRNGDTVNS
ncbi:hypothetical protein FQR65_LT13752 [Abscondita terminalis]|nr:hypothetical protein FQR65_LT13752 [Abscondita terminalis]